MRRVRRNKGRGSQQPAEAASPHTRALPAHLRASPSPEPWSGGDSGADEAPFESLSRQYDTAMTNEPSPLGRRPQRKAAGAARVSLHPSLLPPAVVSLSLATVSYWLMQLSVSPARVHIPSAHCHAITPLPTTVFVEQAGASCGHEYAIACTLNILWMPCASFRGLP